MIDPHAMAADPQAQAPLASRAVFLLCALLSVAAGGCAAQSPGPAAGDARAPQDSVAERGAGDGSAPADLSGDGLARDGEAGADGSEPAGRCARDPALPGDTAPCTRMRFPADAFFGSGGRIIDVTRAPFSAKGDGIADDTAALRAAYTWVLDQLAAVGWDGFFPASNSPSYVIYLPDGTYRVRDTVIYDGALRLHPASAKSEELAWVRIVGESREQTIIRLDDSVPAFAGPETRPVVAFGKGTFNNVPASNALRNLTVRVGSGNPGAVGVYFGGANQSDIENVAIIAEGDSGRVGLDNSIGTILGYQRDLTVEGFDVGIRMEPYHFTHPVIEHATLRGQRVAAIQLVNGTAALRQIHSDNRVPALLLSEPGAHAVLLDSALAGGAASGPAIELHDGAHFFGRGVTVAGYGQGVVKVSGTTRVTEEPGSVDEYVSDKALRFSSATPLRSMALPVEEVPRVPWEQDLARWVKPSTPGDGAADAAAAVRAAMAAGETIYFPGFEYALNSTVEIPCSVRRVHFMFTTISGSAGTKFRVVGDCADPLLLQDVTFDGGLGVAHAGTRPLILQRATTRAHLYQNEVTGSPQPVLFGNMIGGIKAADVLRNVRAFIRCANAESPNGDFAVADAGTAVWVLGFKTEKAAIAFQVDGGAQLEILGGILNQYSQEAPSSWNGSVAIVNNDSALSVVACTNGPSSTEGFQTLIRDTQAGQVKSFAFDDPAFPPRVGRDHQEIIPLYVSY